MRKSRVKPVMFLKSETKKGGINCSIYEAVAQLGECRFVKPKVAGSKPVSLAQIVP